MPSVHDAASMLHGVGMRRVKGGSPGRSVAQTITRKQEEAKRQDEATALRRASLWKPRNKAQEMAIASTADVIGFGGQAGGGKSDMLIGTALTQHHRATIFRRLEKETPDLIERARDILSDAKCPYTLGGKQFRLFGATVQFAGLEQEADWSKWRGRARDFYGFDEATEFTQSQVRNITAWARTTRKGQRVRVILTFNPPSDVAGEWVLRYFGPWLLRDHPNPAVDGELRYFAMIDGEEVEVGGPDAFLHTDKAGREETIIPSSRTFFRARLEDNPFLGPEYRQRLLATPEPLRSQLLYGDFAAGRKDDPWQVIKRDWVMAAQARWKERMRDSQWHHPQSSVGVDVAHGGKDKTVIAIREGDFFPPLLKFPGIQTPDGTAAAKQVVKVVDQGAAPYVNVDGIGYGASTAERLEKPPPEGFGLTNLQVIYANGKSTFTDKSGTMKMRNLRAEMYWRLREALDMDATPPPTLCLPDDPELLGDLCAPRYSPTPSGILVESKEDIKDRLGRSPDCGDAVAMAMLGSLKRIIDTAY